MDRVIPSISIVNGSCVNSRGLPNKVNYFWGAIILLISLDLGGVSGLVVSAIDTDRDEKVETAQIYSSQTQ